MKYLLLPLLFVFYLAPATAQKLPQDAISTYFSEYVDDQNFSAVYVSGKIFQLFRDADLDLDDLDEAEVKAILEVVQDIQGIRVLHTDVNATALWKEAKNRIPTDRYELLFKVRTKDGDNVEAFIQDEKAVISELFLLVGAADNFAMLSFIGRVDLTKLSQLQKALDNE
ncbi:DUF4252 domain-containing protein [Neolewinella lacunae]|uniref:DUF4252 domain-containing protein n=1 Tax=Neolewinella lacunae TaxID=1517758 RepID=A0A923T9Z3_9BACT|nr:DUF4252 domain-containing protein [Neolewinella lacunae]MBC6995593.1 DUF4252 domain-containing protein [Neolewinella lacunae]MDN3635629.1 DUF4252 domain-containing protein [Neolewinella lacunae]